MSQVSAIATELGISEDEVREVFDENAAADTASAAHEKKIEEAAAKQPLLTKTVKMVGRTHVLPIYVNQSNKIGSNGEPLPIFNGPVPEGLGLDGYRVVITPREMFSLGAPHANDPDLAVSFQKSRKGETFDPEKREPLNRCGGLWSRDTKRGRMPVGTLSNPKPRDGRTSEFQLPEKLVGARMALRKTGPASYELEITPQEIGRELENSLFGSPPAPTAAEVAAETASDSVIPF